MELSKEYTQASKELDKLDSSLDEMTKLMAKCIKYMEKVTSEDEQAVLLVRLQNTLHKHNETQKEL